MKWVCGVLDFSLFHSPMFRVLTVFFLTSPIVYSLATYLPAMCKDRGVSDYKAAILLSIIGGLDLCSRLIFGFIADLKIMKVSTLIAISFFLLGGLCHVTSLLTTFPLLVGFAVVFGVLSGVSPCLLPILIMEDIGLEFTPQALGFCKLFSAASMAAGLPLLGYLRDITGSYDVTNHVTGVFTLVSGVLLIALRYFPHRHPRHRERILVHEECSPLTKKSPSK